MRSLWQLRGYLLQRRRTLAAAYLCMGVLALSTASLAYLAGPALRGVFTGETIGKVPLAWGAPSALPAGWAGTLPGLGRLLAWLNQAHSWLQGSWGIPLLIVATSLVKAGAQTGQFYAMGKVSLHVQACLRRDVFAALLRRPPAFFARSRQGDLLSRLLGDTALIEQGIFYGLGSVVRDALALLALLGFCCYTDLHLAAYTLVSVPLVALPLVQFSRALKRYVRGSQAAQGDVANRCHEALQGMAVVQAYQQEAQEEGRLAQAERQRVQQMQRSYAIRAVRTPTMEVFGAVALAGLLGLLGRQVQLYGADPAHYVSFFAALLLMYDPIKKLGNVADYLAQTEAAYERLTQVLKAPEQVRERPGAHRLVRLAEQVHFEQVSFAYHEQSVLHGIELRLPLGARVAVVGESGAGKSTLAHLLPRFWDVTAGALRFDGHDVRALSLHSLRAQIATVPQDPFVFAGSAADNIGYGRAGASRAAIEQAARMAHAHAFLAALPQGYDTPLGERGARLSGGQRQRLAVARAILRDAPLLILDEATSSLDPDSEALVRAALEPLLQSRTSLIIAHRLQTVRDADTIVVLHQGRIAEQGSHASLLRQDGAYARLLRLAGDTGSLRIAGDPSGLHPTAEGRPPRAPAVAAH